MNWLSVKDAATRLGVTTTYVYKIRGAGRLSRNEAGDVAESDVREVARLRHWEAVGRTGGPERLALLAAGVREQLHPRTYPVTRAYGADAIPLLHGDVVASLGFNCVAEAARPDTAGCRWCWSHVTFRTHGGHDPDDSPVYRALFAAAPCRADQDRWARRDDAMVASAEAGEARRKKHERDRAEKVRAERAEKGRALIRTGTYLVTRNTAASVTASVRTVDDGASMKSATKARLVKRRTEAERSGNVRLVGEINAQLRNL